MKYKIKRRKTLKKTFIIFILIAILFCISSAYALWSTQLNIYGSITGTAPVYSVTYNNIENSSNYISQIISHKTYDVTFSNAPNNITVYMGGNQLTQNTDFTYSNGRLIISSVTGNLIINGPEQGYNKTLTINDTTVEYDLGSMTFDEFLATQFNFVNNSGKTISKIDSYVTAVCSKTGGTTGSQYIALYYLYNNKDTKIGNNTSLTAKTSAEEESTARAHGNVSIPNQASFTLHYSKVSDTTAITVNRVINVKFIFTYK